MGGKSKQKGSEFEREICRKLSLWVTHGTQKDAFWRSAMSGGRATLGRNKGQPIRQAGDITAVAPEGHVLTNRFYIECKFYKDLNLDSFFLMGKGTLAAHWRQVVKEAASHDKQPLLIAKQNLKPALLVALAPVATSHNSRRLVEVSDIKCQVYLLEEVLSIKFHNMRNRLDYAKAP